MTQALKDVAVFFDTSEAGQRLLELSAKFVKRHGSRLVGVWSAQIEGGIPEDTFARGSAIGEVIQRREEAVALDLMKTGQSLADAAIRNGINTELRVIPGNDSGTEAALRSLYCDLLILGYPKIPGVPHGKTTAQLLDQMDEPLMIIPRAWAGDAIGCHITVAWNASRPARRAVADALPLLVSADKVDLLIVDADRNSELHGEDPGMDMSVYLERQGVKVRLCRIASQGRSVAEAIAAHARESGSDLVVFGAYSHSRLGQSLFGGVTRSLLAEVPLPLFVSR
jgi:nucleotide-binding universal stress UspA family protein